MTTHPGQIPLRTTDIHPPRNSAITAPAQPSLTPSLTPSIQAVPAVAPGALLSETENNAPAVRLLREILREAATRRASDVHIESNEHDWRIRLRIDGVLHETMRPPPYLRDPLICCVKVLARLDIAERRIPQDGRLKLRVTAEKFEEFRVNTLPTLWGEKLVLRRLDTLPAALTFTDLGFNPEQQAKLEAAIHAPHGMVLVTGPTGSGKTLTLYCFLQRLNRESLNICSVEDPVEIQLVGINQVSVREKAGLTFAVALRAFLRQDPDVIMVGEIRDAETASVALQAAQTGHLVFSTLHTNNAPATLARLLDIGIAPFNLACAIRLIIAQRLIRKLCLTCRSPMPRNATTDAMLHKAGFDKATLAKAWQPYQAVGCAACHSTGYHGRIGIHQVMPVTAAIRALILAQGSADAIAQQAQHDGVKTLREAGLEQVRAGATSLEEILAVTDASTAAG
ncbi:MAG: type IV pilus assembly protein PilB [Glomeribacter sp. 1016415]|nr:type IV pilus assembly protein PilB [Glomeribacter sp. 1016415]